MSCLKCSLKLIILFQSLSKLPRTYAEVVLSVSAVEVFMKLIKEILCKEALIPIIIMSLSFIKFIYHLWFKCSLKLCIDWRIILSALFNLCFNGLFSFMFSNKRSFWSNYYVLIKLRKIKIHFREWVNGSIDKNWYLYDNHIDIGCILRKLVSSD